MLLITNYCFKWIHWAELLKSSFSWRFNPLKVISFPEMKGRVRGELCPPSCNILGCRVQSDVELSKDILQFSGAWKPHTVAEGCLPVSVIPGTCPSWQRFSLASEPLRRICEQLYTFTSEALVCYIAFTIPGSSTFNGFYFSWVKLQDFDKR